MIYLQPLPFLDEDVDHVTTATDSSVSDPANPPNSTITSDEVTMNAQGERVSSCKEAIQIQRTRANEDQTMQSERMVKRSKCIFAPVQVGVNVTIPIPQLTKVEQTHGIPLVLLRHVQYCCERWHSQW